MYTYTFEFNEAEIKKIRNILELKAFELEEMKHPNADEINKIAMIFDNALQDIRKEKEAEAIMSHYDEGYKKWSELFAKMK